MVTRDIVLMVKTEETCEYLVAAPSKESNYDFMLDYLVKEMM